MATCSCGYAIRGKGHSEGAHHKSGKIPKDKPQINLERRRREYEADKARLTKETGWHNQIGMPGSLQVGRSR